MHAPPPCASCTDFSAAGWRTSAEPGEIGPMTESQSGRNGDEPQAPPQAGVLGNLPRSRPAVRSPRRRETPDPAADAARAAAASRPPRTEKEPEPAAPGQAAGD